VTIFDFYGGGAVFKNPHIKKLGEIVRIAEKRSNFRLFSGNNPDFVQFRDLLVFTPGFIIIIREGQSITSAIK